MSFNSVIETKDGGYLVGGGSYQGSAHGELIKYDINGNVQWSKTIGGKGNDDIRVVIETQDGGYLVGGYFSSAQIVLDNRIVLANNDINTLNGTASTRDGMIIKYNNAGVAQWAKAVGSNSNDEITTIATTKDGGFLVGGNFNSNSINLGNNIILNRISSGSTDGMIIKYNSAGVAQWAKAIDKNNNEKVESIYETQDGGFLAGIQLSSSPLYIIKYNSSGNAQWQKSITASAANGPKITSIVGTKDGGYVVGGSFFSASVNLGNNVTINSHYKPSGGTFTSDGMIIKFRDTIGPQVSITSSLNESTATSRGYGKSANVTITITDEGGSGLNGNNNYQYYLSTNSTQLTGGEWINYTPGQAFTIGEGKSGYHYLFIKQVTDNVGNLSTGSSNVVEGTTYHGGMRLGFDNTPPTAGTMTMKLGNSEGTTYTNDTYTNQNVYIEQVEGTDEHSGHKTTTYSVKGPITLENQTNPTTLTEEGIYEITVTTTDNMYLTATRTYTVKIDRRLPTAGTLTMKLGGSTGEAYTNDTWTNESVYISPVDGKSEHSGHKSTTYSVKGPKTLTNQTTPTILTETGIYEITVTTTDYAGNIATNTYTVKIDKTAPIAGTLTMKLESSEEEAYINNTWTSKSVYIEPVDGTDEHSGHKTTMYNISGAKTLNNQTMATTLTETGIYIIEVITTDNMGNKDTNIYTVKIDKENPTCRNINNETRN